MQIHDKVIAAVRSCTTTPCTAAQIQAEAPTISYALIFNAINDLVRNGKLTESRNAVDKRVFALKS